jgi:hypothetical protein
MISTSGESRRRLLILVSILAITALPVMGEAESEAPAASGPHHRLDLGLDRLGSAERDITTFSVGYTWAPGQEHAFHINANYLDSRLADIEGDGLSDTILTYSWAPGEKVTASPWLPRRFGTGLGLSVPTGDLLDGTGSDMWIAAPFVGWPVSVSEKLTLLPSLAYLRSFSEGDLAVPIHGVSLELGFLAAIAAKWWITILPAVTEELELEETIVSVSVQIGREFGTRHGISFEYGYVDDDTLSIALGLGSDINERFALKGHFGFR